MRKWSAVLLLVFVTVSLFTCMSPFEGIGESAIVSIKTGLPPAGGRALGVADVKQFRLVVSAADMETIESSFSESSLQVRVNAGDARLFQLQALSADGVVLYEGSATADLKSGENHALSMNMSRKTFTVHFDTQGAAAIDAIKVPSAEVFTAPAAPTLAKFVFGGWYKDKEGTQAWDQAKDVVLSDLTLYAKWNEPDKLQLTAFSLDGLNAEILIHGPFVLVNVPSGTDLTKVTPLVTHTGSRAVLVDEAGEELALPLSAPINLDAADYDLVLYDADNTSREYMLGTVVDQVLISGTTDLPEGQEQGLLLTTVKNELSEDISSGGYMVSPYWIAAAPRTATPVDYWLYMLDPEEAASQYYASERFRLKTPLTVGTANRSGLSITASDREQVYMLVLIFDPQGDRIQVQRFEIPGTTVIMPEVSPAGDPVSLWYQYDPITEEPLGSFEPGSIHTMTAENVVYLGMLGSPPEPLTPVTLFAIPGITVPVAGQTPSAASLDTAQYTATVSWNPVVSVTFASATVYTATITLTPKAGYTLSGLPANRFSVAGAASVTQAAGSSTVTAVFPKTGYTIGSTGPAGGIVFYENPTHASDGWRYLEAWIADEASTFAWKDANTLTNGTSTGLGTGYKNTYLAMAGTAHPAAQAARNAAHGGATDWFLPSKDELNQMYLQRTVIGGFSSSNYWTSSEYDSATAWEQSFIAGGQGGFSRLTTCYVRVIRAFGDSPRVFFSPNGGTGTMAAQAIAAGAGASLNPNLFSKPGFVFTGWNTKPDGSGTPCSDMGTFTIGNSSVTLYAQWTWAEYDYNDTGPAGGKIFYVNTNYAADGWKYLEVWSADEGGGATYQWKTANTDTPGLLTNIGDGYYNTYTVMNTAEYPAAVVCRGAVHAGFSDWYLPNINELVQMYGNLIDKSDFQLANYWSSSQNTVDMGQYKSFIDGSSGGSTKTTDYPVRAVRRF